MEIWKISALASLFKIEIVKKLLHCFLVTQAQHAIRLGAVLRRSSIKAFKN